MAPSNSMNKMTRPLRRRPSQRAGFETGASSATAGLASWMVWLACRFIARLLGGIGDARCKDERGGPGPTGGADFFWFRNARLVPGIHVFLGDGFRRRGWPGQARP